MHLVQEYTSHLGHLDIVAELGGHVRGALRNGVTVEEIQEVLLQTAIYVGVPAALEAFRVAEQVISGA